MDDLHEAEWPSVVSFLGLLPELLGVVLEQEEIKGTESMRLKLVMGVSSVAAVLGSGACIAIVLAAFSSLKPFTAPGLLVTSTLIIPASVITLGSVFVYRHTARRRKLQALLTALIATVLTLCIFFLASLISSGRNPTVPNQPAGPHIAS